MNPTPEENAVRPKKPCLADGIPGGLFRCLFDQSLTLLEYSDGFLTLVGCSQERGGLPLHSSLLKLIDPRDRSLISPDGKRQSDGTVQAELRLLRGDGTLLWALCKGRVYRTDGAEVLYGLLTDVTELHRRREEMTLSLAHFQTVMKQTNDIVFEWEFSGGSIHYSSDWRGKFEREPLGRLITDCLSDSSLIFAEDRELFRAFFSKLQKSFDDYSDIEVRLKLANSRYHWFRIRVTVQLNEEGHPTKAVGLLLDIDKDKRQAQELLEVSQKDTLTRLYNKGSSQHMIEDRLETANPEDHSALLLIDIDNFKQINDTMGHLFGDDFLYEISRELKRLFRESDVVGRVGGDEFIAFLHEVPDDQPPRDRARHILAAFSQIKEEFELELPVSCSIGISLSPQHGQAFQELFHNADLALYQAKQNGKNQYVVYDGGILPPPSVASKRQTDCDNREKSESGPPLANSFQDKLISCVLHVLCQSSDLDTAVASIFELMGKQFVVSRVSIYENSEDNLFCHNTFAWCGEGVEPQQNALCRLSYAEELGEDYPKQFNEEGVFYCRSTETLSPAKRLFFTSRGIKSTLQCSIRDGGVFRGFVGFDECRENRYWTQEQIDSLSSLSEILSIFLLRQRSKENAEQSAESLRTLLGHQAAWIYVVRPSTHQLLYSNRQPQERDAPLCPGPACHQKLFDRDTPCKGCPLQKLVQNSQGYTTERYEPKHQTWVSMECCWIYWKGEQTALVTCREITRPRESTSLPFLKRIPVSEKKSSAHPGMA